MNKLYDNSVSVIIPCYNCEKTIERALLSVLSQTIEIKEIICIDDCSSDSTYEFLKKISNESEKIKIFKNEKNLGPSFTRNFGVKLSLSKNIAFLDADDYWDKDKVYIQLKIMQYFDYDLISCSYNDSNSLSNNKMGVKTVSSRNLMFRNLISTPSVLMKRDVFSKFDECMKFSEDYNLWLKLSKNKKIGFINRTLVFLGKKSYGVSGLSSHLLLMELGELKSIYNNASLIEKLLFIPFSLFKFFRRLLIVRFIKSEK